ncbi:hypothetical protein ACSBR2_032016 [Camellia fascicularis]
MKVQGVRITHSGYTALQIAASEKQEKVVNKFVQLMVDAASIDVMRLADDRGNTHSISQQRWGMWECAFPLLLRILILLVIETMTVRLLSSWRHCMVRKMPSSLFAITAPWRKATCSPAIPKSSLMVEGTVMAALFFTVPSMENSPTEKSNGEINFRTVLEPFQRISDGYVYAR